MKYNQIGISQSGDTGEKLVKYVKSILSSESPIRRIKTSRQDSYQLIISSKKIVDRLQEFNIVQSKTKIYDLPNIPYTHFNDFLVGYIEGDGCITISDNGIGCKYLSVSFVGTQNFINHCDQMIPIKGHIRKHNLSDIYEMRWNGEMAIQFCDWLYSTSCLYHSYKYENYIKAKNEFKNTRKERYATIKSKILSDLQNQTIDSIMSYAKQINIPFQTIYNWKKKWEREGLL